MVKCNASSNGICRKYFYECTGAGVDLNGCSEWALFQAVQDLTEVQREIANYGSA